MSEIVATPGMPAPVPATNPDTEAFWAATGEGRLLVPRCRACGQAFWYPRPICPLCHAMDVVLEEASGRGTVYSFAVCHRGSGAYSGQPPYVLAWVELEEGPCMLTNIVDADPAAVSIGAAVDVVFHQTAEAMALPRFRLA